MYIVLFCLSIIITVLKFHVIDRIYCVFLYVSHCDILLVYDQIVSRVQQVLDMSIGSSLAAMKYARVSFVCIHERSKNLFVPNIFFFNFFFPSTLISLYFTQVLIFFFIFPRSS